MKLVLTAAAFFLVNLASAQYYYNDIISIRESSEMIRNYHNNKVTGVVLASYDASNTRYDGLQIQQQYQASGRKLTTVTRSDFTTSSVLISQCDARGNITRVTDSIEHMVTTTIYSYNDSGNLVRTLTISTDTKKTSAEQEEHLWEYSGSRPVRMIRVKNNSDTTYIELKADEKGNIIEEIPVRKGVRLEPVYYYYDAYGRLTDIVRYNPRAGRLLPEYMFEYSPANQVIQKISIPSNSDKYLIWRYKYDDRGLKVKEAVYDKRKQLNGTIEYKYSFG